MGLKTKLAMAMATSAAGAAMIAGGSFAYFNESVSNTSNTFTAGSITLTPGGSWNSTANLSNLAPGDNGTLGNVTLTNSGSLDEWVELEVSSNGGNLFSTSYNGDVYPLQVTYTASVTALSNHALPSLSSPIDGVTFSSFVPTDLQGTSAHTVSQAALAVANTNDVEWVFLPAYSKVSIDAKYNFPDQASNDYQNATGKLTVSAFGIQAANNTETATTPLLQGTSGIGAQPIHTSV